MVTLIEKGGDGDGDGDSDDGGLTSWKVAVICVFSIVGGIIGILLAVWLFVWAKRKVQQRGYETINV